jgi:hypothetical protein
MVEKTLADEVLETICSRMEQKAEDYANGVKAAKGKLAAAKNVVEKKRASDEIQSNEQNAYRYRRASKLFRSILR